MENEKEKWEKRKMKKREKDEKERKVKRRQRNFFDHLVFPTHGIEGETTLLTL